MWNNRYITLKILDKYSIRQYNSSIWSVYFIDIHRIKLYIVLGLGLLTANAFLQVHYLKDTFENQN